MAAMLPTLVPMLRRDKELTLTDAQADLITSMSAATIDRKLANERKRMLPRGRSHTKPGSLLKSQIPIRTWAEWDDAVPGYPCAHHQGSRSRRLSNSHRQHAGGTGSHAFPWLRLGQLDPVTGWDRFPYWQSCHLIDVSQERHSEPVEDSTNSRARNTKVIADPVRTPPLVDPQRQDAYFPFDRQSCGAAVGSDRRDRFRHGVYAPIWIRLLARLGIVRRLSAGTTRR